MSPNSRRPTRPQKTSRAKHQPSAKELKQMMARVPTVVEETSVVSEAEKQAIKRKKRHLDERLRLLNQRAQVIEEELRILDDRFYRTSIFGSARLKPETKAYNEAFTLARYLAWSGIDVLTGGGPGLMEAANKGARLGQQEKRTKSLSFGLSIQLEWEPQPNSHLDIKRHHLKFSSRLDDFMRLSHSVVCTPGGIGTLLELMFTWQLVQVKHIEPRPIVLMDKKFWGGLIDWMRDQLLKRALVDSKDFDVISIVDTPEEVYEIISAHHRGFLEKRQAEVG